MIDPKYRVGDTVITARLDSPNIIFEAHKIKRVYVRSYYSSETKKMPSSDEFTNLMNSSHEWTYEFDNEEFFPESEIAYKIN